jgi:hypothetical protein
MGELTFWGGFMMVVGFILQLLYIVLVGAALCLGFILVRYYIAKKWPEVLVA